MTKSELRQIQLKFTRLRNISDCIELSEIFLEHMWNVINDHYNVAVNTYAEKDAYIINQMMFTKLTHLKVLLHGVGYKSPNGGKLNEIIDPTIIASLVRNIFETCALFNLIFRQTNSEEEMIIIYNLWSISGLNYRQRFESNLESKQAQEKIEEERSVIQKLTEEIKQTSVFKNLTEKSKGKIESRIEQKDFRIVFDGKKVKCYTSWQELCNVMQLNEEIFDNIYTYFSLYSHPSQVAVFQFESMFTKKQEFKELTAVNLKYCFSLLSVFIADYIHKFPSIKSTFEKLDLYKQIAIDSFNVFLRNEEFAINDSTKKLK